MPRLPADLDALARAELDSGETVEWAAQPDPWRALRAGFGLWLFAVPWTLFSVFWMAMASLTVDDWTSSDVLFPLFGTPFVLVGLAMLSSPFWAWHHARRTLYTVTDRRAILFEASGLRGISVRSLAPATLRDAQRTERPDGSGSLAFTRAVPALGTGATQPVRFAHLRDVRAAEDAIRFVASMADWTDEERRADLYSGAVDEALEERRERRRERL